MGYSDYYNSSGSSSSSSQSSSSSSSCTARRRSNKSRALQSKSSRRRGSSSSSSSSSSSRSSTNSSSSTSFSSAAGRAVTGRAAGLPRTPETAKMLSLRQLNLNTPMIKEYRQMFDRWDREQDGNIDRFELQQAFGSLGNRVSAEDITSMLRAADTTGDGRIFFPEFCQMMLQVTNIESRLIYESFQVLDTNEDRLITPSTMRANLRRLGRRISQADAEEMFDGRDNMDLQAYGRKLGFRGVVPTDFVRSDSDSDADEEVADGEAFEGMINARSLAASRPVLDLVHGEFAGNYSTVTSTATTTATSSSSAVSPARRAAWRAAEAGDLESFTVEVKSFYLDEGWLVEVAPMLLLRDVTEAIADRTGHARSALRFYYRGRVLRDDDETLDILDITANSILWFIFLTPPARLPTSSVFLEGSGVPDLATIYRTFRRGGRLGIGDAIEIIKRATAVMQNEANMVPVDGSASVIGDIHGQFFDMEEIMAASSPFSTNHTHIFLGDYVDRGYFSCEVMLYLLAAKVAFPDNVVLLRGNHESKKTSKKYGARDEFLIKYSKKVYKTLVKCFNSMPLYCLLEAGGHRMLLVHGGISPRFTSLDDLDAVHRQTEPATKTVLKDVLWSDPFEDCTTKKKMPETWDLSKLRKRKRSARIAPVSNTDYRENSRGGFLTEFTYAALLRFLKHNDLLTIIRAHETKEEGFEQYKHGPTYAFPGVVTVFSAPNYTDVCMNEGAVLHIRGSKMEFRRYRWRLHPLYKEGKKTLKRHTRKEDFVQFAHWLYPGTLYTTPLGKLIRQHKDGFVSREGMGTATIDPDADLDNWKFLKRNLMGVIKLSDDPRVRRFYWRRMRGLLLWYSSYDHFADGIESESGYEIDVDIGLDEKTGDGEYSDRDAASMSLSSGIGPGAGMRTKDSGGGGGGGCTIS